MMKDLNRVYKALSTALIDDFRGFLSEGTNPIVVQNGDLHAMVALQEMNKVPGYEYVSGTGQNPIVDFMKEKNAIYITKIPIPQSANQFQRTIGYLTNAYSDMVEYRGVTQPAYEVLRNIALGMGYDVDEYTLEPEKAATSKNACTITIYKADIVVKKSKAFEAKRSLKNGDVPVFNSDDELVGFMSGGKFVQKSNYKRYTSPNSKVNNDNENQK